MRDRNGSSSRNGIQQVWSVLMRLDILQATWKKRQQAGFPGWTATKLKCLSFLQGSTVKGTAGQPMTSPQITIPQVPNYYHRDVQRGRCFHCSITASIFQKDKDRMMKNMILILRRNMAYPQCKYDMVPLTMIIRAIENTDEANRNTERPWFTGTSSERL